MSDLLKIKIKEFIDLAKTCPDNLQEICFELLLKNHLGQMEKSSSKDSEKGDVNDGGSNDGEKEDKQDQEDFVMADLHVKVKKFLSNQSFGINEINQIFYKEGDEVKPLFDDLKTTGIAESQIRIALLQALKNSIITGDFEFDGEVVREETEIRKCYHPGNFSANFKNNRGLFEGFEKYDKKSPKIKLSKAGREQLAEIIKELQ